MRRAAAALALAATFALAAPVHAAGWRDLNPGAGWIERAVEWIARLWGGSGTTGPKPASEKEGMGLDPSGGPPKPPHASSPGITDPEG
jgi:hypothetical protein